MATSQNIEYLNYYGFSSQLQKFYRREVLDFVGLNICCHSFYPPKFKEVIVLLHGYFDHSGNMSKLINHLVAQGYAVAAFDMPGHGLSEGTRGVITDFSKYSECLELFLDTLIFPKNQVRISVIAHSTGCSTLIEYFRRCSKNPFREIILAAPLIRSAQWRLTMIGLSILNLFQQGGFIKRKFLCNSSDSAYLNFRSKDPLQPRMVSVEWLQALIKWNRTVKNMLPLDCKINIIQGNRDITVDWRYNLPVVQKIFPKSKLNMIYDANHQLFNESPLFLNKALNMVTDILAEQFVFRAY